MKKKPEPTIQKVVTFEDGSVKVYDQDGAEIPELQGAIDDVEKAILARVDEATVYQAGWLVGTLQSVEAVPWKCIGEAPAEEGP